MLSAAGSVRRLPGRRLPGGQRVAAALLLGTWAAVGVLWAAESARPRQTGGCPAHPVPLLSTALHNAMLDAILMSGYVTVGIGTLVGGSVIMILTWADVGVVIRGFGWPGVAVIAPAGFLELAGWYLSVSLGLAPLADLIGGWAARSRRQDRTVPAAPRPARRVAQVAAIVGAAAVVEVLWTHLAGRSLVC